MCWLKPLMGVYKLNTGGSLKNSVGSWGTLIKNHEGEPMTKACGNSPYGNIDEIELDTVYQGMRLAIMYELTNLLVNVDSTTVVYYLK